MMYSKEYADVVVTLDADLQDDIDVINQMLVKYEDGNDLILGIRDNRDVDSFAKKNATESFHKLMRMLGVEITFNHSDFRMMSKRFLDSLEGYREANLFLRGMIHLVGFPTEQVFYTRRARLAGEPTFSTRKLLGLAWDGVTSFSVTPIRIILIVGLVVFLISIGMFLYTVVLHFEGGAPWGWPSLMTSVWAFGGLQLLAIGIIGEYLGKAYMETKRRPRYNIERVLD
jgi:glycosyltransferase involved in cell wall biosynthesis